jgi:hypothetical protein
MEQRPADQHPEQDDGAASPVSPYQVRYLGPDGRSASEEEWRFAHDDAAIDAVGASEHPHEIVLTQGARLVARFPASS